MENLLIVFLVFWTFVVGFHLGRINYKKET